jgi:hypothetical protein
VSNSNTGVIDHYLSDLAECVAEVRGEPLEALAERTTENFFRLFRRAGQTSLPSPANSTSKIR